MGRREPPERRVGLRLLRHLTHDFWHITEHLLNTLRFFLARALLGEGIFSDQCGHSITFTVVSLVWLLVLFLFEIGIHLTLVFLFYPVTSRMGIRPESEGGALYEPQRLVGRGGLACRPGPG